MPTSVTTICYGNGKFVSTYTLESNIFIYSTDGINWTEGTISETSRRWASICYGNGKFVTIEWDSHNGRGNNYFYFAYSTDGINWTEKHLSVTEICGGYLLW